MQILDLRAVEVDVVVLEGGEKLHVQFFRFRAQRLHRRGHLVEVMIVVRYGGDMGDAGLRGAAQDLERIFAAFRPVADAEGQMTVQIDHALSSGAERRSAAQKLSVPSAL